MLLVIASAMVNGIPILGLMKCMADGDCIHAQCKGLVTNGSNHWILCQT